MIKLDKFKKTDRIDEEITRAEKQLALLIPGTDGYKVVMDDMQTLISIKSTKRSGRVSNDTIAIITANLVGIVLILNYEKLDVVSSKAMSLVMKSRV